MSSTRPRRSDGDRHTEDDGRLRLEFRRSWPRPDRGRLVGADRADRLPAGSAGTQERGPVGAAPSHDPGRGRPAAGDPATIVECATAAARGRHGGAGGDPAARAGPRRGGRPHGAGVPPAVRRRHGRRRLRRWLALVPGQAGRRGQAGRDRPTGDLLGRGRAGATGRPEASRPRWPSRWCPRPRTTIGVSTGSTTRRLSTCRLKRSER